MLGVEQAMENEKDPDKKKDLKKQMTQLHNSQMAIKIAMNSLYGATANVYFLYYIGEMAEAITTSGQLSIRYAEKSVNKYLNKVLKTTDVDYIVYIDTDSIYVNFGPLIQAVFGTTDIDRKVGEEFLDSVCKEKLEAVIALGYENLAKKMGAYRNAMVMKREKITDKSVFVAKKRYIMNVLNSEGVHYAKPKISVTGIESVRSSTPEVCREKMKKSFEVIMNGSESDVQTFIEDFREEFFNLPAEDIAKISGTDDIEKYMVGNNYKRGCPMHVRGSILYNKALKENKLENRYQLIRGGDKIKIVYLSIPNPIKENVISFPNVLPKELNVDKYIDYNTQFEKVFLGPIESILEAIGWRSKKVASLESFFI
jgi:DNA polymerase elongation subunit (family B)